MCYCDYKDISEFLMALPIVHFLSHWYHIAVVIVVIVAGTIY